MYGVISPEDTRVSLAIRATKELPGGAEAYVSGTYYHNDVLSRSAPQNIQQIANPGPNGLSQDTQFIQLPVLLTNGQLNPNNPFAAQGETAQIQYTFGDIPTYNEQISSTYRFVAGIHGHFNLFGDWRYTADVTAAETDLENKFVGDLYGAWLLQLRQSDAEQQGGHKLDRADRYSKQQLQARGNQDHPQPGSVPTAGRSAVVGLDRGGPLRVDLQSQRQLRHQRRR
jgi:hypothetical protein